MTEKIAFKLLMSLEEGEIKRLKSYLFDRFNSKKLSVKIFEYFRKKRDKIKDKSTLFDLEVIYKKIQKKEIESKGKDVFLNAIYELENNINTFLLMEELQKDSFEKDQLLFKIYQNRNLKKQALNIVKRREKKLLTAKVKDLWYPLKMMQIQHWSYYNNYSSKLIYPNTRLKQANYYADQFYTVLKLMYAYEAKERARILPETAINISFLKEVIQTFHSKDTEHILAKFYMLCLNLVNNQNKVNSDELYQIIVKESKNISKDDLLIGFSCLNNFMIQQIKNGNDNYQQTIFELFKKGIELKVYVNKEIISDVHFYNIVNVACRVKEYTWAKAFIQKNKTYLQEEKDLANLSLANVYFKEQNYNKTLILLRDIQFHEKYYDLIARGLTLRVFYEKKETKKLISHYCNSFKKFLEDKKVNKYFKGNILDNYKVLIKYVRILIRETRNLPKDEIVQNLNDEKHLLFKGWILEKVKQLEN